MKSSLIYLSLVICHLTLQSQHIIVLGVAQDGGYPHIGCQGECQQAYDSPELSRHVTSLALVDEKNKRWWLFEATPDISHQLQLFQKLTDDAYPYLPEGILITHAHIGHYAGLMFLGKEALNANRIQVYGLPRLMNFLKTNGPWDQLVIERNIELNELKPDVPFMASEHTAIVAMAVPHRDEYSETAGFLIHSPEKSYLFIPDIDKWDKWDQKITKLVASVDYAFLDATFFSDGELPNRAMSEVPHPFVRETMNLFKNQSKLTKSRIQFIHFNHTNPLLFDEQKRQEVKNAGFGIAEQGQSYR